ncbi:hypothetical protein [Shewanella sp. NIFS-20-20]|uniref:hypothetical protein n=1 Tax=Shewanella sp. NIFS-20-20 TaxID=2853806 RepID=UPI001C4800BA|nr:hypothetical protein [Shewanella sp. NIFS-20-20]MBV7317106.1 hypothetical protein [Shewanella sp. NIFS-20-20]
MQKLLIVAALATLLSMAVQALMCYQHARETRTLASNGALLLSFCFQSSAVIIFVAAGLQLLSLSQNFSLLLFISLNQGLMAIWLLWRTWTMRFESPDLRLPQLISVGSLLSVFASLFTLLIY